MAAISADDIDKNHVTFCYEVDVRNTPLGRRQTVKQLPWAFVHFPDSGDPKYVAPLTGQDSVGLNALGGQPFVMLSEYMRNSPFPHEADRPVGFGSDPTATDNKPGVYAIHFFGWGV